MKDDCGVKLLYCLQHRRIAISRNIAYHFYTTEAAFSHGKQFMVKCKRCIEVDVHIGRNAVTRASPRTFVEQQIFYFLCLGYIIAFKVDAARLEAIEYSPKQPDFARPM